MPDMIDRDAAKKAVTEAVRKRAGELRNALVTQLAVRAYSDALDAIPAATAADHCRALLEAGVFADPVVNAALRRVVEGM